MKPKYLVGIILGLILIGGATFYATKNQSIYKDFTYAQETGEHVQVKGAWVKDKGCEYDQDGNVFRFTMVDESGAVMPVVYHGAKPNNFELAEEVVAGGIVENGVFKAEDILTKCPSKYNDGTMHPEGTAQS